MITVSSDYGRRYLFYLYLLLGVLAAFPPLVTDMYLPALPAMTREFSASESMVQLSLAACILGLAVGQLFFGPLSDKYGRRLLMRCALLLFLGATLASIMSTSIATFNICRFFQGLGGAGGVVLSRSVATDCYEGKELAKALAIIGAINGIAPVTAPVIGGLFSEAIGWKGIFWILFAVGGVILLLSTPFRESHLPEKRYHGSLLSLFAKAGMLLHNRRFLTHVIVFGMSNGVLFGYISSASFILQNDFGMSELSFGITFGINAMAIALGSMLTLKMKRMEIASRIGCIGMLCCSLLQFVGYWLGGGMLCYEVLMFGMLFCVGLVFTSATTLAMTEGRAMIGWASAIVGATGFLFGGIVTPLVGLGVIRLSTFTAISACALIASLLQIRVRTPRTA